MYLHSVKMTNFKSIGQENNEIILEARVTAIIGKNESGKSNVLEGLSYMSFVNQMNNAFASDNINRNNGTKAEIKYEIILKANSEEQEKYKINEDSTIIISKDIFFATGGILEFYKSSIKEYSDSLIENLGQNPFQLKGQDYTNYRNYIAVLQNLESLNIRRINAALSFFEARIAKIKDKDRGKIEELLLFIREKWDRLVGLLPNTFYRNSDKVLKTQYKIDEIEKEFKNPAAYPNSLLSDFVKLIDISYEDFLLAVKAGSTGQKTTLRKRINRNVETIINNEFKSFYATEPISLSVEFDSSIVSFSVQSSDGESLLLSERSNGLKWYLNTFIDAKANGVSKSNVVYLFDEPGISLHVNAQKELLNLFEDLASKNNQIVYTTHSPYMLNLNDDGIHRIRATDKDTYGYTHIFKTAYDARLSPQNQQDTLAPIVSAIGMTLNDTFGPAKDKLNIVTEGVSDYIYLFTMAKILDLDMQKINIIPAVGVSNCLNVCNILAGWNCPFIAIFDYDKEGVESGGEKMNLNFSYEIGKQYIYLKDTTRDLIECKDYKSNPYRIEDLIGRKNLEDFIKIRGVAKDAAAKNKTLLSKLFCNALEDGSFSVDQDCRNRFKNLFDRLSSTKI